MVQHISPNSRRSRAVEVDCRHLCWVVGNEEITVNGREHGHQSQWSYAQTYAQWIECPHCCSLRKQHDRHEKQRHCEEERILSYDASDVTFEERKIAVEERIAHPCDAKNADHGIHSGCKYVAFHGILHLCFAH